MQLQSAGAIWKLGRAAGAAPAQRPCAGEVLAFYSRRPSAVCLKLTHVIEGSLLY